jgi:hypothetical protein
MLPGFRFLFAAIVLSMSILVFGLGAAALLRAAHEEFASTPSWRANPEPVFAQRNETQGPSVQAPAIQTPVLAMLQVEPPAAETKAPDPVVAAATPLEHPAASTTPAEPEVTAKPDEPEATARPVESEVAGTPAEPELAAAPAEPERSAAPAAEPERTAALPPENSSQPETAKSEMPVAGTPTSQETVPAQAVAPAAADETKLAANLAASTPASAPDAASAPEALAPANEVGPTAAEPVSPPAAADANSASTKIATLGGPAVTIEAAPVMKTVIPRHVRSFIRRHVEARRKTRHHRTASRSRFVQQYAQPPADPFDQYAVARRR